MKLLINKYLKSKERKSGFFLVISIIIYIILTFIAMRLYPGGYSFTEHTYSYLGQIKVNGVDNTISRILFIIASTLTAIALIPFWFVMPVIFSQIKIAKMISICGTILGIIGAPFLSFIAIIPLDWGYEVHMIPTDLFFIFTTAAISIYSIAIFLNKDYNNLWGIVFIAFTIASFLYIFRIFDDIRPIMQKIIIYGFILWVLFQFSKIWKVTSS